MPSFPTLEMAKKRIAKSEERKKMYEIIDFGLTFIGLLIMVMQGNYPGNIFDWRFGLFLILSGYPASWLIETHIFASSLSSERREK